MLKNSNKKNDMDKETIKKINDKCPYEQGIFVEPYGIPVHIKEPVIYMRKDIGGMSGGSCWGTEPEPYINTETVEFEVLDLVLMELKPNITYLQYKMVNKLIHTNNETQYEYYGNSTDYEIKYIILSELEKLLETF
jgi:hypothetical protein